MSKHGVHYHYHLETMFWHFKLSLYNEMYIYLAHFFLGQFLKSNIFKYCILGLLPQPQEATLCRFLDALSMLLRDSLEQSVPNLDSLDLELNEAMALMERDFPCVIQVPFLIKDQWYNLFILTNKET